MLKKLNELLSTRSNWIPFEQLEINEYFTSGGSCDIYKGKHNNKNILLKTFDSKHYDYEEGIIDDIVDELYIYSIIENNNQLCKYYGFSFSNLNKSYQTYIVIEDYNVNGDFKDFIKSDILWSKYENTKLNKYEYYYKFRETEWIYNLDRDYKIHLTESMCKALKSLHDKNIVHCDLKPNNMLLVDDEIILIDFGVARNLYDKKIIVTDEDMGTLGYMCEELGFGMCSKKSDIFSLGVCILELWVGEIWQEGDNYEDCRKEVLNSLKYLESKEKELGKIIRKCVLKDPKKRPYIQTILKNLSKIV